MEKPWRMTFATSGVVECSSFCSWHEAHPGSDVDWHDIANQYEEGEDFVQLMRSARSQEIHKRGAVLRAIVPS